MNKREQEKNGLRWIYLSIVMADEALCIMEEELPHSHALIQKELEKIENRLGESGGEIQETYTKAHNQRAKRHD